MKVLDAVDLAYRLHGGQVDKAGQPYVKHCIRVAIAVAKLGGDEDQQIAALLHDAVEDECATFEDLKAAGVPPRSLAMLFRLTHYPRESYKSYMFNLKLDPDAVLIKRADLADNMNEDRLALLEPAVADKLRAKYAAALEILNA